MRIDRLRLRRFKAHDELEIEPAAGLTVIRGPNEAGKSTIQQALELGLFRKADSARADVREAWSWGSEVSPEVELAFEADEVEGTLRKRFGGSRAEAELTLDGESITDYTLIGERIASLTGVPTEAFYRATAGVAHSELDAVAGEEPAIGDRLQKAISGADRGTAKAKRKLETAIHRYRTEGHKNPGLLKVNREQVAMLEGELATGEAALARLQADRAAWVAARERREELEVQLRRQQADLAEAKRAAELAQRRDGAHERWVRLKRAAELKSDEATLRRDLPTDIPLAQLRGAVTRARDLELEASELEAEIDVGVDGGGDLDPELLPPRPMAWLAAAALLVVAGWVAMFLLRGAGAIGIAVVAVIAVGVTATLVQAFRGARRRRRYGLTVQLAETAATQHREQRRAQEELLRRKRRELDTTLDGLGVSSPTAAEELLATVEAHAGELAAIEGELRGLGVDESNIRRLEEARDQAAGEAERAEHALAAMGSLAEDPLAARAEGERQVAQTGPARDAARSEEDQAQGRVDANTVDAELVAELAERLAAARERGTELERRVAVYEGTLAAIEAAEQATLKTAARFLEERMGPTISEITGGRYDDIEVDEATLSFRVRVPETGDLVDVEQLSQGTADQLYLAARLGLVRLVTLDRRPPLILDDPFVTFDPVRAERALRHLRRFAHEQGFQVLYLTCSDRFDALADELVVLPAPSSGEAAAPTLPFEPEGAADDPPASLRQAAAEAPEADRDAGVVDPFGLGRKDR